MPKREEIANFIKADAAFSLTELASWAYGAATIAVQDATTCLSQVLNRLVAPANAPQGIDLKLAFAIASCDSPTTVRPSRVVTGSCCHRASSHGWDG